MKKLLAFLLIPFIPFVTLSILDQFSDDVNAGYNGWMGLEFDMTPGFFSEVIIIGTTNDFSSDNFILPTTFQGRPIRYIAKGAFEESDINSVNFSYMRHLREIQSDAFKSNDITTLDLSGLSNLRLIARDAFANNNITDLNISGLSRRLVIEEGAFDTGVLPSAQSLKEIGYISKKIILD